MGHGLCLNGKVKLSTKGRSTTDVIPLHLLMLYYIVVSDEPVEDHYSLLVKAWEQKVFPTIRRRFRNEAERKDGLEQIRGALQLGQ